jgi:hypothetical protein
MNKLEGKSKLLFISCAVVLILAAGVVIYMTNPTLFSMLHPASTPTICPISTQTINPMSSTTANKQTGYTLDYFKSTHENDVIIASGLANLDEDDVEDYIILYQKDNHGIKKRSNVCIMMENHVVDVDIAGGDIDFYFAYDDKSLVIDPKSLLASIYLYDVKNDRVLEYHLSVTNDPNNNSTNIKIDANEVKPKS